MKRINIKEHIRTIADFPKKGILFYDICSLLMHPEAWQETVRQMTELVRSTKAEKLVAVESRGFLVTAPVTKNFLLNRIVIKIAFGFITGLILSFVFYKLIEKNHDKLVKIARNFPKKVDISLYKDTENLLN